MTNIKKYVFAAIAIVIAGLAYVSEQSGRHSSVPVSTTSEAPAVGSSLDEAIAQHARKIQVDGEGVVTKVLADDISGSRHQKFIVQLNSGTTVLIAHNIDLAPRVTPLRRGDAILFRGEYEWNEKGGVVHWTHHDPDRRHAHGWIKRSGQTFE